MNLRGMEESLTHINLEMRKRYREKGKEAIFKEVVSANFPESMKDMNIQV